MLKSNTKSQDSYYQIGRWYSITINPINKHQYFGSPLRYIRFRKFVRDSIRTIPGEIILHTEISEPRGMTVQGYAGPRLHCHGVIQWHSQEHLMSFLMNGYYNLTRWTSVDIDTIDDLDKWLEYCKKQRLLPKNIITNGHKKKTPDI